MKLSENFHWAIKQVDSYGSSKIDIGNSKLDTDIVFY